METSNSCFLGLEGKRSADDSSRYIFSKVTHVYPGRSIGVFWQERDFKMSSMRDLI